MNDVAIDDLEELESLKPLDSLLSDFDPAAKTETSSITELDQNSMLTLAIPERIVTDQVSPLNEQLVDNGFIPSALDQNTVYTAVGTTQGKTLLFDAKLVATFAPESTGSVTSLALGKDGKRILIGYSNGEIFMYDTAAPKSPLRKLPTTAHCVETAPVKFLSFVGGNSVAIVADSRQGLQPQNRMHKRL